MWTQTNFLVFRFQKSKNSFLSGIITLLKLYFWQGLDATFGLNIYNPQVINTIFDNLSGVGDKTHC